MVSFPSDQTVYITFTCAFFVGIYFATFLQSLRCLLFTRRGWESRSIDAIQWPIVIVTLCIFVLSSVNYAVELMSRAQEALLGVQIYNDWKAIVIVGLCFISQIRISHNNFDICSAPPQI